MQMMKSGRNVAVVLAMGALVAALSGCQKEEGPAERAGKAMDSAVDKAGQEIEKAGEKIQDTAKDAKK
jgi:predicted small secreted protein